jgi:hypothetical protein
LRALGFSGTSKFILANMMRAGAANATCHIDFPRALLNHDAVRRAAAIVLVLCYACLGSGALERWHNAQHAAEDSRLALAAQAEGTPLDHLPFHDDSNCPFHAKLHLPLLIGGWVPLLVCLGLLVAFLTMLRPPLAPQLALARIDCRGPPRP